jgi:hypothetical protein
MGRNYIRATRHSTSGIWRKTIQSRTHSSRSSIRRDPSRARDDDRDGLEQDGAARSAATSRATFGVTGQALPTVAAGSARIDLPAHRQERAGRDLNGAATVSASAATLSFAGPSPRARDEWDERRIAVARPGRARDHRLESAASTAVGSEGTSAAATMAKITIEGRNDTKPRLTSTGSTSVGFGHATVTRRTARPPRIGPVSTYVDRAFDRRRRRYDERERAGQAGSDERRARVYA